MKRLMIAGFGDVARRALPRLEDRFEVLRIARRYGSDLDRPESLALEGAHALKQVLGVRLRYPTVYKGLRHEHALGVD